MELKNKYNELSAQCRNAVKKYEVYNETKLLEADNAGAFYKYVNKKMGNRTGIGALKTPTGEALTDNEKANTLNSYLSSTCTVDNGLLPEFDSPDINPDETFIDVVIFDVPKLCTALRKIKTKSKYSSGPDGYPIILLLKLANALVGPLSLIYNSLLSIGKLPSIWKTAVVTPFYKKRSVIRPGQLQANRTDKYIL